MPNRGGGLTAWGQHALFQQQINDLEVEMGLLMILQVFSISLNCLTVDEL